MPMRNRSMAFSFLMAALLASTGAWADGVSAVKTCEGDTDPPEEVARLTLMPNGEPRGSDTAATIVKVARQKAKEGKDAEAIQWAALCNYFEPKEQEAIRRDSSDVLKYLKQ